jgi:Leucine-rich repeat (LRR) protein
LRELISLLSVVHVRPHSPLGVTSAYNVPDTEVAALQDLYDATNGNSWNWHGTGNKWNFTYPNPCIDAWQGVNCSQVESDGFLHVIELSLHKYGLAGSIPPTIDKLEQLDVLNLGFNSLVSTIPASVGQLTWLTELHLDHNHLNGSIPDSLAQLTQLRALLLDDNQLSGIIPDSIAQLTDLSQLYLNVNQLFGTIPVSFSQLTQLTVLDLDTNLLTGTIPDGLQQLTLLTELYLEDNFLTGTIPAAFQQLTQLTQLYLSDNLLTGTIPDSFNQLTQLTILDLDTNQLSGIIPESVQQLTQLKWLLLYDNRFSGTVPASVGQLTQLTLLNLGGNLLSGTVPEVQQLTQLVFLFLYGNQLTATIPTTLGDLSQLTQLDLDSNQLSGTIPESFQRLTQLAALLLYGNHLTGTIPNSLGQLVQLVALGLELNQLTGTIPDTLQQLTQLIALGVNDNMLTGTIPASLDQLTLLNLLTLQHNQLSGPIPDSFQQLTLLALLDVDGNQLTGTIPAGLGDLTQLVLLWLDANQLSKTIPDSLQQLTQLSQLYLESNQLTGSIPGSLVSLLQLRVLQLNDNQLTGPMPDALSQLTLLEELNMQGNQLTGTIPPSLGQLPQLRVVTFAGNQLHGAIPQEWSAAANTLQLLHVQKNHLSETIPQSLGYLPLLLSLNLSSNRLTGTIPVTFQQLGRLRVLMLHNNQLRGNITQLFTPAQQRNLSTVQLSGNQLTGTVPAAAFLLPSLSSFAAVDNCFEGPLPEEAICSSASLGALVLDGLHSAKSCKRSASLSHHAFKLGPLPQCLLSMPNLATLHLSGSGLTGSLPGDVNISAALTDLSLSHNLLSGKIPPYILQRNWNKLDLSYNRLSGTMHAARKTSYSNATKVYVQQNRLSGVIPGSMQRVGTLSLLENNMFSCRADRSDVPQQGSDSDKYSCGSDAVNNALYAWIGAAVAAIVVAAIATLIHDCGIQAVRGWFAAAHDARLPKLQALIGAVGALRTLGAESAVYCVLVLLPVYSAVNAYHPSYTYKYAWTLSGVFLTGTAAFALEAVFLFLQLPICAYVAERLLARQESASQPSAAGDANPVVKSSAGSSQQTAVGVAVLLFSLLVVTGINVAFVFATLNLNGRELTVIQILLAVFKLGFNNIVAPRLHNRVGAPAMRGETTASRLMLALMNVIVIPCVVVMFISPSCFYDALTGSAAVTSSYHYGGTCEKFVYTTTEGTVTCADVQTQLGSTTYTPPFAYSYQCSSSFVTSYAPTFVIMCIISAFVVPAQRMSLLWLRRSVSPTSRLYSVVNFATPRIRRELPSPQDLVRARSGLRYRPLFDANKVVVSLLTYLALLLTFGALFPPLAVCCAVAMASVVLTARLEVGRYVSAAVAADRQDCLDEVESACSGVATPQQLRMALNLVLTVSCMFYTLFLFDTLGYEVGFAGAFWVLIVVPLLPVMALVVTWSGRWMWSKGPTVDAKLPQTQTADPELGVELAAAATQTVEGANQKGAAEMHHTAPNKRDDLGPSSGNPLHLP